MSSALNALLYGDHGEKWPLWMGHLPWDVRDAYARILTDARHEYEALKASTATTGTDRPDPVPCACHEASGSFGCELHGAA